MLPEVIEALQRAAFFVADGELLTANGAAMVTKVAVEPVWYLPGVAKRFGCTEAELRRVLFEGDRRHVPPSWSRARTWRSSCRPSAGRRSTSLATRATWPARTWS